MKPEHPKCCRRVHQPHSSFDVPCSNKAKYEVDGKWYCGTHNPEAQRRRKAKNKAHWDQKMKDWSLNSKRSGYGYLMEQALDAKAMIDCTGDEPKIVQP